jgi:hypothetical protein
MVVPVDGWIRNARNPMAAFDCERLGAEKRQ